MRKFDTLEACKLEIGRQQQVGRLTAVPDGTGKYVAVPMRAWFQVHRAEKPLGRKTRGGK